MNSITSNIKANKLRITPNTMAPAPPSNAETMDVAKLMTAKNIKKRTAITNVMIGMSRGRQ